MPKSVEEVIGGALIHAYDPVKAHEYYMRTRELKGRKHGAQVIPIASRGPKKPPTHQVPPELEAKIHHLEARLNELRDHLRKLLESKRKKANESKHPKPETAADKQKKAAANKKYQQRHKSEIAQKRKHDSSGSGGGSTPIANMTEQQLKDAIVRTRENLHAAVAKARAAANRGTA